MKNDEKSKEELNCHFKIDIRNLTNFDSRTQKSQILHLNGLLLTEVYNILAKKDRGITFYETSVMQNWKKNWLVIWKITWAIWQIFTRAHESLKIWTLMASFCLKFKMYELKICRGVMCHDNEEWYKNWRGIDMYVQNWHEEFDKFWPEHSKISKSCTLMGCFWSKYVYNVWAKKVQWIYVW